MFLAFTYEVFLKRFFNFVIFLPVFFRQSQHAHDIISFISHCVHKWTDLIFLASFTNPSSYAESLVLSNPIWPAAKIIEVEMFLNCSWLIENKVSILNVYLGAFLLDFLIFCLFSVVLIVPELTYTLCLSCSCRCCRMIWNVFLKLCLQTFILAELMWMTVVSWKVR